MGGASVPPAVHAAGVDWWNARFPDVRDDRVHFSSAFLPALLASSRLELATNDALSLDELRVVAKYCIADAAWQHDTISLTDFTHFLARFGPLDMSLQRLVESLTVHRELVTWFHGTVTRADAEKILLGPSTPSLEDGAFLVRYSDSQPSRLCVSYLKVHTTGPHVGKRETRNVLIENAGQSGFVLTDSKKKAYPSVRAFVQRTAARLKHGIASSLSRRCNIELAAVRARQDLAAENAYTTFSTDSLEQSSSTPSSPSFRPSRPSPSLLFTNSPVLGPARSDNQEEHLHEDDNYSGFTKSSLLASLPISTKAPLSMPPRPSVTASSNGYGSFSAAAVVAHERTPPGSPAKHIPFITTPPVGSDYGDFAAFTSAVTSFSRVPVNKTPSPAAESHNDYAAFDAFVPSRTTATAQQNATVAPSEDDAYGAFEPFALDADVGPPATAEGPVSRIADVNDEYGSFAALTLSSASPVPPRPTAAFETADNSDVYGTFSLSPRLAAESGQAKIPPVSLGAAPETVDSSDTYGSFEAFNNQDSATVESPGASSAADAILETKASPLDELNEGMELFKQKRLDDALQRFIRAREAAKLAKDVVVEARALGNLGTVYLEQQNPQQAVTCYQQSLEITRSIQDVKRERLILNNLVLALMAAEDYVSAYQYCQVQLETTVSEVNRRKIFTRMSELRERAARASRTPRTGP